MRRALLVSVVAVAFLGGSAFGFYLLPTLSPHQAYALAFTQEGACSPHVYGAPWSVALNEQTTVVEPTNDSMPPSNTLQADANYQSYSVILFHVTNGVYTYVVSPHFFDNGTVTIDGADKIVTVYGPFIGCTTTST